MDCVVENKLEGASTSLPIISEYYEFDTNLEAK